MKLFIDSANFEEIKSAARLGVIDGVTTNPSLIAGEDVDFESAVKEICEIVDGPVSAEVVATDTEGILEEAREIADWDPRVVVKVPLIPDGIAAVSRLSEEGIRTNVTLCFSANQALLAAKAGATYVSPFLGRLDDIGMDGLKVLKEIVQAYAVHGFDTEILAASLRHPDHVREATQAGADIATLPYGVFEDLFEHPLTDRGLEQFLADWEEGRQETSEPQPAAAQS